MPDPITDPEQVEQIRCPVCGAHDSFPRTPGDSYHFPCQHHTNYLDAVCSALESAEERERELRRQAEQAGWLPDNPKDTAQSWDAETDRADAAEANRDAALTALRELVEAIRDLDDCPFCSHRGPEESHDSDCLTAKARSLIDSTEESK